MSVDIAFYKKAHKLNEVGRAVRFDIPVPYHHEFYTDFSDVRGEFEEKMLYRTFDVEHFVFNREANVGNKNILFLAGTRGSGKTSELAKIASKLHKKDCFFCVNCNLEEGVNQSDMEYMDILIFQIERLCDEMAKINLDMDRGIIEDLQNWFSQRVKEVNTAIKNENGFEIDVEVKTPSLFHFFQIASKIKSSLSGSKENALKIRSVFKNNFTDFAKKFNSFVEGTNMVLRREGVAQEIFFIIDGLEKIASKDIRRKIILEDDGYIQQIKVNSIFTLPIELFSKRNRLETFSTVSSFPFIKIREKDGTLVEKAINRFEEFVYKRIESNLFDSPETVRKAILLGGGSPRILLRILNYTYSNTDEDSVKMTEYDLEKAVKKLAAQNSQYISKGDWERLKILKEANETGKEVQYDETWQDLFEDEIVLEYNDGTYKRVNPIIEASKLYKQYVG